MTYIKNSLVLLFLSFFFIQCSDSENFLIEKKKVGEINSETTVQDLASIFINDSIVSPKINKENSSFLSSKDEYEIFSKDGNKLLSIFPDKQNDSTSTIKNVRIFSPKYMTESGVGLNSNFKEINTNFKIDKVETTLSSAILYIDELNATISIDKSDLGPNQINSPKISVEQIPDISKIKYFTVWIN